MKQDRVIKEYSISKSEVRRRINAFTSLSVSFVGSLAVLCAVFLRDYAVLAAVYITAMALFFLVFWVLIFVFFKTFIKRRVILTEKYLKRVSPKSEEAVALSQANYFKIRTTTRNKVRDIRLGADGGKTVIVDGLEDFEDLAERLEKTCDVKPQFHREKFDYDSNFFYPFLGVLLSLLAVGTIKFILGSSITDLKFAAHFFAIFIWTISLYFVLALPFEKRYGGRNRILDYTCGLIALLGGVAIWSIGG